MPSCTISFVDVISVNKNSPLLVNIEIFPQENYVLICNGGNKERINTQKLIIKNQAIQKPILQKMKIAYLRGLLSNMREN